MKRLHFDEIRVFNTDYSVMVVLDYCDDWLHGKTAPASRKDIPVVRFDVFVAYDAAKSVPDALVDEDSEDLIPGDWMYVRDSNTRTVWNATAARGELQAAAEQLLRAVEPLLHQHKPISELCRQLAGIPLEVAV